MADEILRQSILNFILTNKICSEKGEPLDFSERLFLLDILTDWSQEIVLKKCSQVGGSVIFTIKVLYAPEQFRWNIIYTFPSDSDVSEFVATKTNKIIEKNPQVWGGLQSDNIERKQIGDRFVYYKGTISKTAAIMTTADILIHDEIDRSHAKVIEDYRSRIKASSFKGRWLLSNPTTEKGAIDLAFRNSDQREWVINCQVCSYPQILRWPESIDLERKCRRCVKCSGELSKKSIIYGRWEAQNPGHKVHGYHISHLMCAWISAEEIIADSEKDQEYFYNFVLGEPYNPGDLKVSRATILDNWTPKKLETGNWFLGVDVGNIKHYVLGSERGIVKVGKFTEWSFLDEIIKQYSPVTVIDAMPENTMSKYFVDTYPRTFMSYFNGTDKATKEWLKWGEDKESGVIHSDRNRALDMMINEFLNARILIGVPSDFDFREYLRHWETLRREKEVNNAGIERYIWASTTGVDHFVFATLYYYLATLAQGYGKVIPDAVKGDGYKLIQDTTHGAFMGDIARVLEEKQNE